jgi:hypothetical protein
MNMTLDDLMPIAETVIDDLSAALILRGHEAMLVDNKSQLVACLQLGLRSASMMRGMAKVLALETFDSYEVLARAAIEARDLLMHFRFDDRDTKVRIGFWFAGKKDNSWQANHAKLDKFLADQDALLNTEFKSSWEKLSVIAHPTMYAADNSTVVTVYRMTGRLNWLNLLQRRADYVVGVARLALATVWNFPRWIPLGLDIENIEKLQLFCQQAETIGGPIVNTPSLKPLPAHSLKSPKSGKGK